MTSLLQAKDSGFTIKFPKTNPTWRWTPTNVCRSMERPTFNHRSGVSGPLCGDGIGATCKYSRLVEIIAAVCFCFLLHKLYRSALTNLISVTFPLRSLYLLSSVFVTSVRLCPISIVSCFFQLVGNLKTWILETQSTTNSHFRY